MSDVERLEDELNLAKAHEALEAVRARMHADRSPANIAAYKKACAKTVKVRQAHRLKYPPVPGDAVATPQTLHVSSGVNR